MEIKDYIEPRMLIDGKLVEAQSGKTFDVINPATEEVIGSCADGSVDDASLAIEAARRAFDETDWATNPAFRKNCLEQLQKGLDEEREDIRALSIAEAGAPFLLTFSVHTDTAINDLSWFIDKTDGYEYEVDRGIAETFGRKSRRVLLKEPVGVVAAITPWNFPLWLNLNKIAPALAMGNAIVLKPAPDTPFSATVIGRIVAEKTDIPPGIVNVVTSSDHLVGEALVGDPRVDMVTFTGSTATGKKIMAKAAETVKRVHLELGGKSAAIILDDADFATAVPAAAGMVCAHAGQGCVLTTRMLVPRARYEEAVQLAKTTYDQLAYGDPTNPSHLMGPLINSKQRERVLSYIEQGKKEARLVTGGGPATQFEKGYFVQPTIFADVDPDSTVAQEEIFGPVLVIIPFEDDDDAVRIANNSTYGLSGSITSGSEERAMSVAKRVRTGTMGINGAQWLSVDAPFGGYRQSGIGRELGEEGLEEYLEIKTVALPA